MLLLLPVSSATWDCNLFPGSYFIHFTLLLLVDCIPVFKKGTFLLIPVNLPLVSLREISKWPLIRNAPPAYFNTVGQMFEHRYEVVGKVRIGFRLEEIVLQDFNEK